MENKELDALEEYVNEHRQRLIEECREHHDACIVITLHNHNKVGIGHMNGSGVDLLEMISRALKEMKAEIYVQGCKEQLRRVEEEDDNDR